MRPAPGPHVGVEFVTGHVCFFPTHLRRLFSSFSNSENLQILRRTPAQHPTCEFEGAHRLSSFGGCVPLAYHSDEGRGRQKRPVLVTSMQPLLARKGHSFMSRFLLTLVPSERYSGERSLRALHDSLSADLANLFHQGFEVARLVASLMFRANCGASFS